MRARLHPAHAAAFVLLANCGSQSTPVAEAPDQASVDVVVDVPAPPKPTRELAADIFVDAVAIGDEKGAFGAPAGVRGDVIHRRLSVEPTKAVQACLDDSREASRAVFFARVERGRKISVVKELAPQAPSGFSACVAQALAATPEIAELGSVALVVDAQVRVPSKPCEGPACPEEGLVGVGAGGDPEGNVWGDDVGDAFGAGGLGLTGIGEGGGGIGVSTLGTGQGFGNGSGRLGGVHKTAPPSVKMGGVNVQGRLPPEVVQRIVRQNFGRFRMCYEGGLRRDPKLEGSVTVQFEIGKDGAVSKPKSVAVTDLKDQAVVACIVKSFASLSFPAPEGGVVVVKYPIKFAPGGGTAAPPKTPTIAGKRISDATAEDVSAALVKQGWTPTVITAQDSKEFVVLAQKGEAIAFVTRRSGTNPSGFELSDYDSNVSLIGDSLLGADGSLRSIVDR